MVAITFGCPHSPSIGQRLDTRTLEIIECVSLNVIYTRFLERNRSHSTNDAKHHEERAFYHGLKGPFRLSTQQHVNAGQQ